ncbi:hypothetical protein KO494_02265 [Lacinutrix sp. C3R15]|uniref:DUF6705 family protein n=1 Tax=Flavobacteriaceae TaxID=49546 RepID=UPI001C096BC8|nr:MULTISPECIES: DUF6705 family protein [Flavobacteriaceae]MBU2938354.1 hypothetical protein [Lacinutrix sp. C3R15]MDO6621669.1 hypothetical protein [Oceanihabitans sp. 1_MG-2023]
MKAIIKLIIILSIISCKAQSPLFKADPTLPAGTYYKDLNNDLDKFVGTWKWEENNSSFTITLQKIEQYFDGVNYQDMLIGEYKYIDNGNLVVNTLPLLSDSSIEGSYHNISGCLILNKFMPLPCEDCSTDERRVKLFFDDQNMTYKQTSFWLRHRIINGIEQIDAKLIGYRVVDENNVLDGGGVPFGEYTLIKQ